jgi:2,4-dienoyl-CoA reductase-like NADH-dependent reductase (Old Yellow Enzyme family)
MTDAQTPSNPYPRLFSPFPDEHFVAHHATKARGGAGWIGSETILLNSPLPHLAPDEFGPGSGAIRFAPYQLPGFVEAHAKFCEAVHDAGAVVVSQLTFLNATLAASAVPTCELYDAIPHAMTEQQIAQTIAVYGDAAEKMLEAGADGIETPGGAPGSCARSWPPSGNASATEWRSESARRERSPGKTATTCSSSGR